MTSRIPVIAPTALSWPAQWDYRVDVCRPCLAGAMRRLRTLDIDTKFRGHGACVFCRCTLDVRRIDAGAAKEVGEALGRCAPWVGLFAICRACGIFVQGVTGAFLACQCQCPPVLSPVQMASWGSR